MFGIIPNQDDPEFRAGQAVGDVVSFTAGFARLGYAGSAKLSSMVLRRSPTLANAMKAVENRNMLKKIFRLNPWSEFRIYPYSAMSAKYGGDTLEIIKASGRTNPYLNGLGAGLIAPTGDE
jgi:hypothetical protein